MWTALRVAPFMRSAAPWQRNCNTPDYTDSPDAPTLDATGNYGTGAGGFEPPTSCNDTPPETDESSEKRAVKGGQDG
jgi:hypothetical protein